MRQAIDGIEAELARAPRRAREAKASCSRRSGSQQRTHVRPARCSRRSGYCNGIENYSRHLDRPQAGRAAVDAARLLPDGLPDGRRRVATRPIPQVARHVRGRPLAARTTLVELRLPPALRARQPPAARSRSSEPHPPGGLRLARRRRPTSCEHGRAQVVEQVIRPTGLIDPEISVRPTEGQIDDLLGEIRRARGRERARARHDADQEDGRGPHRLPARARRPGRATSTARSTRSSASRSCATCGSASSTCWSASTCCARASTCPRSSLVAILDADKEGFLRSETSLIQTIGRAARNVDGQVIMYADTRHRLDESGHRRDQPPAARAAGLQRASTALAPRGVTKEIGISTVTACVRQVAEESGAHDAAKQDGAGA